MVAVELVLCGILILYVEEMTGFPGGFLYLPPGGSY